jgi:hypothetical protein
MKDCNDIKSVQMSGCDDICRIVTHETLAGTFYIAQRKMPTCGIPFFRSSGHKWESFVVTTSDLRWKNELVFEEISYGERENVLFKDIKLAEIYCGHWIRTNNTGVSVKVWTAVGVE